MKPTGTRLENIAVDRREAPLVGFGLFGPFHADWLMDRGERNEGGRSGW